MSRRAGRGPNRSLGWVEILSGLLYFVVAGFLVYFRFVSFRRVEERMAERGIPLPGWMAPAFTAGVLIVLALFVLKGLKLVRQGRGRLGSGDPGPA